MKKLITIIGLCLFLFSCKKDLNHIPVKEEVAKRYEVTFNVSDFSQEVKSAANANTTSDAPITVTSYLTYIAYNSKGKEVSRIKQYIHGSTTRIVDSIPNEINKGILPYGVILDSLASGTFTVVMIASRFDFSINTPFDDFKFNPLNEANFHFVRSGLVSISRTSDTFFKKFEIQVGETGSEHKVVLDRIVAKAEFHILDSKESSIFAVAINDENEAFKFSNEKPFGETADEENVLNLGAVGGKENIVFSEFVLNTESPVDVTILAYANPQDYENRQVSASKTFQNVQFIKNKRIIFRGNIFPSTTSSFTVTVNEKFDADTGKVTF